MQPADRSASRRGENYAGRSREERRADRRARIVNSAVHLFAVRAYDDVTVADVCAGAKVSKRDFYEFFADRDALMVAVHRESNDWLLAGIGRSAPRSPASLEDLFRPMMGALVTLLRDNPDRARVVYINAPRMELRRRGLLRQDAAEFGRLIARAVNREPPDARRLLALTAGITELMIDWLDADMAGDPAELAEDLTALCIALVD